MAQESKNDDIRSYVCNFPETFVVGDDGGGGGWPGEVRHELHYILHCDVFKEERNTILPSIRNNKSLENFVNLLKSDKISILRGLANFLNVVFGVFE